MRRNAILLVIILFAALLSQACSTDKYKQVKCNSAKLESFIPVSLKAFNAVVQLELDNPAPSFKIKDIQAVVKRNGEEMLTLTADPVELEGKTVKTYRIPFSGELMQDITAIQLVSMLYHFDPEEFTIDASARANVLGNIGKDVVYKDLPLAKFLKK